MQGDPRTAIRALNRRFLIDHALVAAHELEQIPVAEAVEALEEQPSVIIAPVIGHMAGDSAAELVGKLSAPLAAQILAELTPSDAIRVLGVMEDTRKAEIIDNIDPSIAEDFERLMHYPEDCAGRLMETRIAQFRDSASVEATVDRLRASRAKTTRSLFIIDENNRLAGRVNLQELAVAPPDTLLRDLAQPVAAVADPTTKREALVELLDRNKLVDLPVIDMDGRLVGIIFHQKLIRALHEDATVDIQTMVGASRDERALSSPIFAVRKRLPWLQINLLTAFLAAAVVGLFENTISQLTALAVLLPVVAGQSGNAGAQALAVTMRGLALREIGLRHWLQVTFKEVQAGFVNGLAVALTCGLGVYVWSGSPGLVIVIALAMLVAMVTAGFAGAVVPIVLTRLGQDPAQSSSIILTTVTDVAGFFSFLGIATLMMGML